MYTTIKVPRELVDSAALVRQDIGRWCGKIPRSILSPERCLRCGGELEVVNRIKFGVEIVRCRNCGYAQPRIRTEVGGRDLASVLSSLGLGVLVGLGFAALLYVIESRSSFREFHEKFKEIVVESDRDLVEEFIEERR